MGNARLTGTVKFWDQTQNCSCKTRQFINIESGPLLGNHNILLWKVKYSEKKNWKNWLVDRNVYSMANKDVDPGICPAWKFHSSTKFYHNINNFTLCLAQLLLDTTQNCNYWDQQKMNILFCSHLKAMSQRVAIGRVPELLAQRLRVNWFQIKEQVIETNSINI